MRKITTILCLIRTFIMHLLTKQTKQLLLPYQFYGGNVLFFIFASEPFGLNSSHIIIYVTRYSKRYHTAFPTSYWLVSILFNHERAAVFRPEASSIYSAEKHTRFDDFVIFAWDHKQGLIFHTPAVSLPVQ